MQVFGADGITVQQFNEGAGGQVVFHLHVHVIPRKAGVPMKPPASEKEKPEVLVRPRPQARGGAEGLRSRSRPAERAENSTASPASTPANTERRTSRNATKPHRSARESARRAESWRARRAATITSCASTPASIAVATALTQTMICECSSRPRTKNEPEQPPDLVRQEADQDQRQVGRKLGERAHRNASRNRWTR